MTAIPGFTDHSARLAGQHIAWSQGGDGPPVLLLHGFPQTRAMWRGIAPGLARDVTVIAPDLRGYGESGKPDGVAAQSFREMAGDQLRLMAHLGFARFDLVGHDRGARVGHRLALDAPETLRSLTLMDIAPTLEVLERLTAPLATAYYHWFFLAQPAPLPERLIAADPDAFFERCLAGWAMGSRHSTPRRWRFTGGPGAIPRPSLACATTIARRSRSTLCLMGPTGPGAWTAPRWCSTAPTA